MLGPSYLLLGVLLGVLGGGLKLIATEKVNFPEHVFLLVGGVLGSIIACYSFYPIDWLGRTEVIVVVLSGYVAADLVFRLLSTSEHT